MTAARAVALPMVICLLCGSTLPAAAPPAGDEDIVQSNPAEAARREASLLSNTRQLTFEGRRAGEGYFSQDGSQMVFQSEREAGNPFFQIYVMDLETGDIERVSPGHGKTTCAWIHPNGDQVLFASTHGDPDAREKQREELARRAEGTERRYSWDYDEHFEIYVYDRHDQSYRRLTNARGYDAEGSWSPNGEQIAFASNRQAYQRELPPEEQQQFEIDPAYLNDIYIMDADGSNVCQLTTAPGYDGGPFFSPDGSRICWRRFTPDGAIAEIWTMNTDGSDQRQLTRMGAMSWAPFYHPSGEYLIFTTNRHGFANFELYLIDAEGQSTPARVTHTAGFDGLPVFTPDGKQLAWTSNRTASRQSQIFLADWNHEAALERLGLDPQSPQVVQGETAQQQAVSAARQTSAAFASRDILRHVAYLCRPELEGRLTGTAGEKLATAYVAAYLDSLGLLPAGDDGGWFQQFSFTAGVALGDDNRLSTGQKSYEVGKDWTPVSFSQVGPVPAAPVVFAGYGISAPAGEDEPDQLEYDSFVHLDVSDKWVLVLRYMPESISAERRQQLSRFSSLRYKAMQIRDRGAHGMIVVSGPNSGVRRELIQLRYDGSLSGASIPVISITDALADQWLAESGKTLKELQDQLDTGDLAMGFTLADLELSAHIAMQQVKRRGRNVLGRLPAGSSPTDQVVIVGAHIDHLGKGPSTSSLARDDEKDGIHFGADDNASGVAAMLEIAQYLAQQKAAGNFQMQRDILFAAWSGEELGLYGSSHFVKGYAKRRGHADSTHSHSPATNSLHPHVAACLNLDMVGRLDKRLILQGVGSSKVWRGEIERRNAPVGLPITLQNDSYIPTDASVFFMHGVPILSAFTGSHSDYHTPRDTPEKLNLEGAARIARFMGLITRSLAMRDSAPDYVPQSKPENKGQRARLRAYLGTIPDYAESATKGVKLSGVANNGPAAKAGVKGGDIIVELAGKKIENIYDYTYAIEALKIGQPVKIVVQRGDKRMDLNIVPGSRD